jgi:hypothetical protein
MYKITSRHMAEKDFLATDCYGSPYNETSHKLLCTLSLAAHTIDCSEYLLNAKISRVLSKNKSIKTSCMKGKYKN